MSFDRINWICLKCGQANYVWYMDEVNSQKVREIELKGMDVSNTCINCLDQRNPKTKVKVK